MRYDNTFYKLNSTLDIFNFGYANHMTNFKHNRELEKFNVKNRNVKSIGKFQSNIT